MKREEINVDVKADLTQFDASMKALTASTKDFGRVFASTINRSVKSGRGFDDVLKNLGKRFADLALKKALKPLDNLFDSFLGSLTVGAKGAGGGGLPTFGSGGAFSPNGAIPFARGGVIGNPAIFSFGKQLGVMGEKGPEAILPLKRSSDGRLGVASSGTAAPGISVTFNVQAADAASFRKSEGQISTMLARVVSRGHRGF